MTTLDTSPAATDSGRFRHCFPAELAVLVLRPGVWAVAVVWMLQIVVFAYTIPYVLYRETSSAEADVIVRGLSTDVVGPYVAASVAGYGIPVFVMLGALAAAADYRWGTLRTIVTMNPDRNRLLLARVSATAVVCVGLAILTIVAGVAASMVVGAISDEPVRRLDGSSLVVSAVALGLGMFAYAAFGMFLGLLLRNAMMASAVGIGWLFGVEMLMLGALAGVLEPFDALRRVLLSPNVGSLASALDSSDNLSGTYIPGTSELTSGPVAALVLALWIVICTFLSARLFSRRDLNT